MNWAEESKAAVRARARELDIEGRSSLSHDELVAAVQAAEVAATPNLAPFTPPIATSASDATSPRHSDGVSAPSVELPASVHRA